MGYRKIAVEIWNVTHQDSKADEEDRGPLPEDVRLADVPFQRSFADGI